MRSQTTARTICAFGKPTANALVSIILQERKIALRQVVELERAATAGTLEDRWLEIRREDRGRLQPAVLLMIAPDAVKRRKERRHRAAADHVADHRGLQYERHRASMKLVALDACLSQELAPRAYAERVHVRDPRGIEHDAA